MRDFETQDPSKGNDLVLEYTQKYKVRNMLRIMQGDLSRFRMDGFYIPQSIIDGGALNNDNIKLIVARYLSDYGVIPKKIDTTAFTQKGVETVEIETQDGKRYTNNTMGGLV